MQKRDAAAFWVCLVLVESVVATGAIAFMPPAPVGNSVVEWDPGFTFFLPSGLAYVNTSAPLYLTQGTTVGSTWLLLDNLNLSIQKLPASGGAVSLTIDLLSQATQTPGTPALIFDASAPAGSTVWFNITNFVNGQPYVMLVDNSLRSSLAADTSSGKISTSWSEWSSHRFEFDVSPASVHGPGTYPFVCSQSTIFLFTTRLTCTFPFQNLNWSAFVWLVDGNPVGAGQTMTYDITSATFGTQYVRVSIATYAPGATEPTVLDAEIVPIEPAGGSAIGWIVVALVIVALLVAFGRKSLPSPHNPTYREDAIKVSFYPEKSADPTWVSFRQHAPNYPKYASRHKDGLWVVYGIRKDGKAEIQTVREPVDKAPKTYVLRALEAAPASRRERIRDNLTRRGVL